MTNMRERLSNLTRVATTLRNSRYRSPEVIEQITETENSIDILRLQLGSKLTPTCESEEECK